MGLNCYYEEEVEDQDSGKSVHVEFGVTNWTGKGEKGSLFYFDIGGTRFIMDDDNAKKFVAAVDRAGYYLGYNH